MTRLQAFSDIIWALLLTILGAVLAGFLAALGAGDPPQVLILLVQGLIVLGGLQILLHWRGQKWQDLALNKITSQDLIRALKAFALMFLINMGFLMLVQLVAPSLVETHQERLSDVGAMFNQDIPFAAVVAAMLFVGFYEEVLARGFLLRRCQDLIGGTWGPVLLSAVLFGLGHFYQGILGIIQTTLLGIVFAGLVLRWQSLWPVIIAHALLNSVSLAVLRELESQGPVAS